MVDSRRADLDARLAFHWHASEMALVGLLTVEVLMGGSRTVITSVATGLGLVALIGVIWSWRHLPGNKTRVESDREKANANHLR